MVQHTKFSCYSFQMINWLSEFISCFFSKFRVLSWTVRCDNCSVLLVLVVGMGRAVMVLRWKLFVEWQDGAIFFLFGRWIRYDGWTLRFIHTDTDSDTDLYVQQRKCTAIDWGFCFLLLVVLNNGSHRLATNEKNNK